MGDTQAEVYGKIGLKQKSNKRGEKKYEEKIYEISNIPFT